MSQCASDKVDLLTRDVSFYVTTFQSCWVVESYLQLVGNLGAIIN